MERIDLSSILRHTVQRTVGVGLLASVSMLAACGGGGGGGGGGNPDPSPTPNPSVSPSPTPDPGGLVGDAARRAVLADIGDDIILPALRDFDAQAASLVTAAEAYADAPADVALRQATQAAWDAAMTSWQRNEVLQVGPAGRSTNPDMVAGGQDFRDLIYSWPVTLNACALEAAADAGTEVNAATPINRVGLGALEHLLFTDVPPAACDAQPDTAARAAHVVRLAQRVAVVASALRDRWEPDAGNFIEQWRTAGDGSNVYMSPQAGLNAVSIALFYAEKSSKDRKIAYPSGLPAAGLECTDEVACPEFLESRLSRRSGENLIANYQAFRDVFTGVNDGLGMNDLLEGIGREELAAQIVAELDDLLAALAAIEDDGGFDAAVEGIDDSTECMNAFSSSSGLAPCALLGVSKTAMDTFRGPIVSALNLAVPQAAAGDND
ncbi:imelysin family protein [Polycyclovorans algicola]|uniref:imelysin family protein n=1 Tax=Polycyclovorans algicola TaxID=616992 RepID=UPI0004A6BC63|nr:imelysin family protein [Polycyclovorans algicola]